MRSVPTIALLSALARHPRVWGEALRAAPSFVRRSWWRTPPFLPLPDGEYLAWRVATAYGSAASSVDPADVVAYLEWRKRQR